MPEHWNVGCGCAMTSDRACTCQAAVAAMQQLQSIPQIQSDGCAMLRELVRGCPVVDVGDDAVQVGIAGGGVEAVCKAAAAHLTSSLVQQSAYTALKVFAEHPRWAHPLPAGLIHICGQAMCASVCDHRVVV